MLIAKGRLDPGTSALAFMNLALAARSIATLPNTPEITELSMLSMKLPETVSADPADRLIATTAIHHTDTKLKNAIQFLPMNLNPVNVKA